MEDNPWTKFHTLCLLIRILFSIAATLNMKYIIFYIKCENRNGQLKHFFHPIIWILLSFLAQSLHLVVYRVLYRVYRRREDGSEKSKKIIKGNRHFNVCKFFPSSFCGILISALSLFAHKLVHEQTHHQVMSVPLPIVAALLSICVLKRIIRNFEWAGNVIILIGFCKFVMSDYLSMRLENHQLKTANMALGLTVLANVLTSVMFVLQEKFVKQTDAPPFMAIGWEGVFGVVTILIIAVPCHYIAVGDEYLMGTGTLADFKDSFIQIKNNPVILVGLAIHFITTFFKTPVNMFLIKDFSGTTAATLNTVYYLFAWPLWLLVGAQFRWLKLSGYFFIICGIWIYF